MPLSDVAVRNAKPASKPVKLTDGGGLYLLVNPGGSKLWRLKYRFSGKEKLLSLGAYPAVSLAKARTRRDEARVLLADGVDPSTARRDAQSASDAVNKHTLRAIGDEYVAKLKREGRAERTIKKIEWLLKLSHAELGSKPISKIRPAEVLAVLQKLEAKGTLETARRLRSTLGSVFRYAIASARAENDPTSALKGALTAPQVQHRAAITDIKQLGGFLRSLDAFDGQPPTAAALRLLPILFPRPGELRAAEWAEFDLNQAVWTIPAVRAKMRRPHRIPLPTQAIDILQELHKLTGGGKLVLPSVRTNHRPLSDNTLNAAIRRLGYNKDEVTAHGFRATASTLLNESGLWNFDAIERQLAHIEANAVRRAYARGEFWDERVRMMQWWADFLMSTTATQRTSP